MNKLMATLLALGAIGGFGLLRQESFQTQSHSYTGAPVGEVRTVYPSKGDKVGYAIIGGICALGCLYFVVRIRKEDMRK